MSLINKSLKISMPVYAGIVKYKFVSSDCIMKIVCNYYKLSPEQLKRRTRKREIVDARKVYIYFIHQYCYPKKSLKQIAVLAGYTSKGSHATALHHVKEVKNNCEIYPSWYHNIEEIKQQINAFYSCYVTTKNYTINDVIKNPELLKKFT